MADWRPSDVQLRRLAVARRMRRRSWALSSVSALVFFGLVAAVVVSSAGWPTVRATFFDWSAAVDAWPDVVAGFWVNVRLFLLAEPLILVLGLAVAAARVSTAPVLLPVRLVAVGYTDLFRGLPTILVVFLVCFGVPALRLQGVTSSLFWLALVALVLSYGAYVAEVFRAGIDSVHPSQVASATALGLSHAQTLRHVVVPQAVRRVLPPLLNDFISLQKDTALLSTASIAEVVLTSTLWQSQLFNLSPVTLAAAFFIIITIPQARFVDALIDRDAARRAGK